MKKLLCILPLLLFLALPALADGLPEFASFTGTAPISREQLISDSYASTLYTGPADALTQAMGPYLAQLPQAGMKQQLCLPMQQADCTVTLYAFALADSPIPVMTCSDASMGWVISDTHLLLDLRVFADGTATVEILCRPELLPGDAAAEAAPQDAAPSPCAVCDGQGSYTRSCSACDGQGHTSQRCATCSGRGQRRCSSCGGDGHRTCSSCKGSGHHASGSHHGKHHSSKACSSCGGDGQRGCSNCSGSGLRSCTACNGHGTASSRCAACSGHGQQQMQCHACGGTGCAK